MADEFCTIIFRVYSPKIHVMFKGRQTLLETREIGLIQGWITSRVYTKAIPSIADVTINMYGVVSSLWCQKHYDAILFTLRQYRHLADVVVGF